MRGRVVLAAGGSPPSFFVSLGYKYPVSVSSADGAFAIAGVDPGKTFLRVSGPGFDDLTVADVTVSSGNASDVGTLTVTAGRSVTGTVLSSDGAPVAGAIVSAGPRLFGDGSSAASSANLAAPGSGAKTARTDDRGAFAIAGLSPESAVILADHPTLGRSDILRLPAGQASAPIEIVLRATGAISGLVSRDGPMASASGERP